MADPASFFRLASSRVTDFRHVGSLTQPTNHAKIRSLDVAGRRAQCRPRAPLIHFFPIFSKAAEHSALGEELRKQGVEHQIIAGEVRLSYKRRIWLFFLGLPKLAWFAAKSAIKSLVFGKPRPQVVVLGSDIEVLIFAFIRLLFGRTSTKIVLSGFIFTERDSRFLNAARRWYYQFVLQRTACVICQSALEAERYNSIFAKSHTKFTPVLWGTEIYGREQILEQVRASVSARKNRFILSAGRSGRDYQTLVRALRGLPNRLQIVCDSADALRGISESPSIQVLRGCYAAEYIEQLSQAEIVVIPLAVDDISAGQMVLIQAMALGKPIIVTGTPTISEYVKHGEDALLVPRGDAESLRNAIIRLTNDPGLQDRLGANAQAAYEEKFSTAAYIRRLVETIRIECGITHGCPSKELLL